MTNLVTDAQAKTWLGIGDSTDDTVIGYITAAVSANVRGWCGRSFNITTSDSDTARYFAPLSNTLVQIDDASTITSVATDDADDGTYSTAWATGDWQARPVGGIGPTSETGWPYSSVVAVESRVFPTVVRPAVKIVGKWGWASLPGDVFLACEMMVAEMFRAKAGGYDTFTSDGGYSTIRRNAIVRDLLAPYRRSTANDARFLVA